MKNPPKITALKNILKNKGLKDFFLAFTIGNGYFLNLNGERIFLGRSYREAEKWCINYVVPEKITLDGKTDGKTLKNSIGLDIPIELISPRDKNRHDLVAGLHELASELRQITIRTKREMMDRLVEYLREKGIDINRLDSSVRLTNFPQTQAVQIIFAKKITVNEEVHSIAQDLNLWLQTKHTDPLIQQIIYQFMSASTKGNIPTSILIRLLSFEVENDPLFAKIQSAIRNCFTEKESSMYLNFLERTRTTGWKKVPLNFTQQTT